MEPYRHTDTEVTICTHYTERRFGLNAAILYSMKADVTLRLIRHAIFFKKYGFFFVKWP